MEIHNEIKKTARIVRPGKFSVFSWLGLLLGSIFIAVPAWAAPVDTSTMAGSSNDAQPLTPIDASEGLIFDSAGELPEGLTTSEWQSVQAQINADKHLAYANNNDSYASSNLAYPMALASLTQQKLTVDSLVANDLFGSSVTIDGDTVVVGVPKKDHNGSDSGVVYVFVRNGNTWEQQAMLDADDTIATDNFGISVSLSGDTLLVGANGHDPNACSNCGAAYVFVRTGTTWNQQAKLTAATPISNVAFAEGVALSGETAVIGAHAEDGFGAAYVFVRTGTTWAQQQRLTATVRSANYFARSVEVDGDTILIGAYRDNGDRGAVYVFERSSGIWTEKQTLTANDVAAGDQFSRGALSMDGDTFVAGSVFDDDNGTDSGSAYVFVRSGSTWSQQQKLTASTDGAADNRFGNAVAVDGNTIVVGSVFDDDKGSNSGTAYLFERSGSTWNQQQKLTASDGVADNYFGHMVAVSGQNIVVAANGVDSLKGAAYVFAPVQYTLSTNTTGTGSGSITLNPTGGTYDAGTVVTATVTPDTSSIFSGWSGDCTGTGSCIMTMDANKSITATLYLPSPNDFVITVQTNNSGMSNDTQFTIPTTGSGYNYNVDCDNDGNDEATAQTGNYTCSYSQADEYTIRIKDNSSDGSGFPRIFFDNNGDKDKLLSIDQWGTSEWKSMARAFLGCSNLTLNALDNPNLSSVTDMSYMFTFATNFDGDVSGWNTSNVTEMGYMFHNAPRFNGDVSSWNTSKVTNLRGMFEGATNFNGDVSTWQTSNVTSMVSMFRHATSFNGNVSSWNTGKVTDMGYMFYGATSFNGNVSSWNTSNVHNMMGMFMGATSFNSDMNSWDTNKVTNMTWTFKNAASFDQNIGDWNVTSLRWAYDMFKGVKLSTVNYDALLSGWAAKAVRINVPFSGGNSQFCNGEPGRNKLINTDKWGISDGGKDPNCSVAPPTTGNIRYVATDGNDAGACLSTTTPCATVAYALNQAKDGDIVQLAAGTYTQNGIVVDKNVTIRGAKGSDVTIDGQHQNRIFVISQNAEVTLDNFIIEKGSSSIGGGVWNKGTLTINNCAFNQNHSHAQGTLYNDRGNLEVTNCAFTGNWGNYGGGGISNAFGTVKVNSSTFERNYVGNGSGAGINNMSGGTVEVNNSTFALNNSTRGGGGISNSTSSTLVINNSIFNGNAAALGSGGGIANYGNATINNSTFSKNIANNGGGIYTGYGVLAVNNSTLSSNRAKAWGGGVYTGKTTTTINNSILRGNTNPVHLEGDAIYHKDGTLATNRNVFQPNTPVGTGTGNIFTNPGFVREPGPNGSNDYGDLRLKVNSPARGLGQNCTDKDINGIDRSNPCSAGAYEFKAVSVTTTGVSNSSSTASQQLVYSSADLQMLTALQQYVVMAGHTFSNAEGDVTIDAPAGAVIDPIQLVFSLGQDVPDGDGRESGMVFTPYEEDGTPLPADFGFQKAVTLTVAYDPALVVNGPDLYLKPVQYNPTTGQWAQFTSDVTVDVNSNTVTFSIMQTGEYGLRSFSPDAYVGITPYTATGVSNLNGGDTVTYTLSAENTFGIDVTNLMLSHTLPAGLTFDNWVSANGAVENSGVIEWDIASLADDSKQEAVFTAQISSDAQYQGETILSTATLTDTNDLVNSSATAQISVNGPVNPVTDTVTTRTMTAVTIHPLFNDENPDLSTLSLTAIGSPANGTAAIVDNTVVYTPTVAGEYNDSFSYTVLDGPFTVNGTIEVRVANLAHLHVSQLVQNGSGNAISSALPGQTVTFTIDLANFTGGEDASNAAMTATIPAELQFMSWITQSGATLDGNTIRWSAANMTADTQQVISFEAKVIGDNGDVAEAVVTFDADNADTVEDRNLLSIATPYQIFFPFIFGG